MSTYERQTYALGDYTVPNRYPGILWIQLDSNPDGIGCAFVPERNLAKVEKEINLKNKI